MRPRSSSSGHNTSASVTVTVTIVSLPNFGSLTYTLNSSGMAKDTLFAEDVTVLCRGVES